MEQDQGIKIRALPRPGEDKKDKPATPAKPTQEASSAPPSSSRRWIIYIGSVGCALLAVLAVLNGAPQKHNGKPVQQKELSSLNSKANDKVSHYMQEAQLKTEMMAHARQMENLKLKKDDLEMEPYALDQTRVYGVQMDQEDTASKLYDDLNGDAPTYADSLPADKINARLANRRWTNELERNERIAFVRGFIKSAYDRGYEVQLDQNLVVVGVKKISAHQKVSIDQVLNKLAKQGL